MPKFTLIAEHIDEDTGECYSKVTHEFNQETLDEVVMSLQEFLRGVGYYFEGDLGLGEPVRYVATDFGKQCCGGCDTTQHSHHYYDTDRNR